ncbi:unnamed protein product [Symbiodinium natans]|uniref:Plastid lipid-associated protein/fibrillin conserved domain-containing protein n=1 Tax=Symbiodinium natans TaxID=878477 RepID=A0A812I7A3_9DINO|nr:unnamed protein product [Symbiodinium natans]
MAPFLFRLLLVLFVAGSDGLRKHHRRHGHKRAHVAQVQAAPDTKALVSDEQMMAEERMAEQLVKEAEEKVEKELAANTTTTKEPTLKDKEKKTESTSESKSEPAQPAPKSSESTDGKPAKPAKQNEKKEDTDKDEKDDDEEEEADAEDNSTSTGKDGEKDKAASTGKDGEKNNATSTKETKDIKSKSGQCTDMQTAKIDKKVREIARQGSMARSGSMRRQPLAVAALRLQIDAESRVPDYLALASSPSPSNIASMESACEPPCWFGRDGKRRNLDAAEVAKIVRDDLVNRQFLATADFSPEIYDESCTFTDEIDTYQKDKFIKGTKALFVGSESNVQLVGDVDVLDGGKKIQFRFQETLAFNFPIVHPKVTLSGTCTLTRGEDGLIVAYREKWDQSVPEVLLSSRL